MKNNIYILTEERPKNFVIEKILEKTSNLKELNIKIQKLEIIPLFINNIFQHFYKINGYETNNIDNIFIKLVSCNSSFVDFLVFIQKEWPEEIQLLKNCVYAIEETKTNTFDSRNTAMGQRSSKFNSLNYYITKHGYKTKPIMFFSHKQANSDHKSVLFINRLLLHLECGIEFWGKNSESFKKFKNLEELIQIKNDIADTNNRNNDTPIKIKKINKDIYISGLLANPNRDNKKYTGRIGHDPNMGQLPLICKGIRDLGWEGKIIITDHQIKQEKIGDNKFTKLANLINFELQGIDLPKSDFSNQYWFYEINKEKVSSILAQIILENNGYKTIFDNHGGCEKSYFLDNNNNEIAIKKNFSSKGGKIPDLVMINFKEKKIYQYEAKQFNKLKDGIKEIKGFDLFEKDYLSKYYPKFEYIRGIILNGGDKIYNSNIHFHLFKSGKVYSTEEFNKL